MADSFKLNSIWMLGGNALYALAQFLITVVVVRLGDVEQLGVFSLAVAITAPVMLFSNMGLRVLWVSDIKECYEYQKLRGLRLLSSFVGAGVCCAISLYYAEWLVSMVILLVGMSKVIENQSDIVYAHYHRVRRQDLISKSLVLRSFSGLAFFTIGMYLSGLVLACVLYVMAWVVVFFVVDQAGVYKDYPKLRGINFSRLLPIVVVGAPLAVSFSLINLNMNIPRLIIEEELGVYYLGVFAAIYFFVQMGSVVVNSIGQVLLRDLAELYAKGDVVGHLLVVGRVLGFVLAFSMVGALGAYWLGERVLTLIYGEALSEYANLLVLAFILSPVQYSVSVMNNVVVSVGARAGIIFIQLVTFLVVILVGIILVNEFGVAGAWYSYAAAMAVGFFMYISLYIWRLGFSKQGVG